MVSSTHEQNSICSQKKLNDIAHEHTIICRQLFAGHMVGSWPMKRKKHLHRMIIIDAPKICVPTAYTSLLGCFVYGIFLWMKQFVGRYLPSPR